MSSVISPGPEPRPGGREAGFTLLEILVALVVLGVLLVTLSQGTRFGFATWGRQNDALRRLEDSQATDRTLRRLIEEADPGTSVDAATFTGLPGGAAFVSTLPFGPDGKPELADVSLRLAPDHRLVLDWLPHLHATRLVPAPPPAQVVLLRHVAELRLSYWSAEAGWSTRWHGNTLPGLVRIHIAFDEPGRSWPDIVAAPREELPGG